jgi:hypothetical protein
MVTCACLPSNTGNISRRTTISSRSHAKTQDPIQKITKSGKDWVCGLSGKVPKALSLNPSITKKKKRMVENR